MATVNNPNLQVPSSAWERLEKGSYDENDLWIVVMGVTGSGKTTFISRLLGRELVVGHDLESCTSDVDFFDLKYKGKTLHLIDTPGFDDTYRTDIDILTTIVNWLNKAYKENLCLSGIVYLHPINYNRMGNSHMKNMTMFKKLCGPTRLPSVVFATTMWTNADREIQLKRHDELSLSESYWGNIVTKENVFQHYDSAGSAFKIIDHILTQRAKIVLEIQRQMVDEGLRLVQTSVGQELNKELLKQRDEFERRLKEAERRMQEEIAKGNREAAEDSRRVREEMQHKYDIAEQQRLQLDKSMQALLDQKNAELKQKRGKKSKRRKAAMAMKVLGTMGTVTAAIVGGVLGGTNG
ncbi:hypothetical protein ONZ43_g2509 [Nemania bipapillata]|uniref:Uncharacterized protein n=1 Tax=Nemania bipapillata TaxID=110536 RepID=A0ACC2J0J5_9PEZI|nr:hypothetical protein ONZ43_g2509 [Nemania bipapillata]